MVDLLLLAVLVGVDNLRVGLTVGWAGVSARQRIRLTFAFGLAESGMPIIGLALGRAAFLMADVGAVARPLVMAVCALLCLAPAADGRGRSTSPSVRAVLQSRWAVVALPVSLGLDNLVAGVALAALHLPLWSSVAVIGIVSSAFAALGLRVGDATRLYRRFRRIAALAVLGVAGMEIASAS